MYTNNLLMFHLNKSQTGVIYYVNKAKINNSIEIGFNSEKNYNIYQTSLILIEYLKTAKSGNVVDFETDFLNNEIILIYKSKVNEKRKYNRPKLPTSRVGEK